MTRPRRFEFRADDRRPPPGWESLSQRDYRGTLQKLKETVARAAKTPSWAEDLLRVLRAAHLVDRRVRRAGWADNWSRDLELRVQVSDASRWEPALPRLERLLSILTSDRWTLSVRGGAAAIDQERLLTTWKADAVLLFSGGLDSSAYAAHHLQHENGNVVLVSHGQGNAHSPQAKVAGHLQRLAGSDRRIHRPPISSAANARGLRLEGSTRSRGLSYLASAVFIAAAHEVKRVIVPENGQLAINPPLTAARRGACSTRSVHPAVLDLLNEAIRIVGGDVSVHNPFLDKTKGEVCELALAAGLDAAALGQTVSCGSHTKQRGFGNCGYCFPCLIRRSGLQHALDDDPTPYILDLDALPPAKAQHVYDLQQWISRDFGLVELLADLPLPNDLPPSDALAVIDRGRAEIRQLLVGSPGKSCGKVS